MTEMQSISSTDTGAIRSSRRTLAFQSLAIRRFGTAAAFSAGLLVAGLLVCGTVAAQDAGADEDEFQRVQTPFAAGVLIEIPPAPEPEETFSGPFELRELRAKFPNIDWTSENHPEGDPHFEARSRTLAEQAKQVTFRREVYCLEFSFKPLRQIYADLPTAGGELQRKLVTYMVFRVRYRGNDLRPAAESVGDADLFGRIEAVSYPSKRAFPILQIVNHENGNRFTDKILPAVKARIAAREQIRVPLFNTVEISGEKIPYSGDPDAPGVWGVATWTDVDADVDFLSVEVYGLTNAFQHDGLSPDAPYRRKALSLNFFRPGDAVDPTEDRIRFGVPPYSNSAEQQAILDRYGLDERLDYRWIF